MPGATRVDGDALLAELPRRGLGKADQAGLRGSVVGLAEFSAQSVDRGDVDNAAIAPRRHKRRNRPDHIEGAGEIDREHRRPIGVAHLRYGVIARDAGIVDEQAGRAG